MKKILKVGLSCLALSMGTIGCGVTSNENVSAPTPVKQKNKTVQLSTPMCPNDIGSGIFYLSNESGSTQNGDSLVVYVDDDLWLTQMGYDAYNYDGSLLTYIYINGKLCDKIQLGEMTTASFDLQGQLLTTGQYLVEFVQYANNDVNADIVAYHNDMYEIK